MIDAAAVDIRLRQIDLEAIESLASLTGVSYDVALKTYKLGLLLRYTLLKELANREVDYTSKIHDLLRNDTLVRFVLLLLIPALRLVYGPVTRLLSLLVRYL